MLWRRGGCGHIVVCFGYGVSGFADGREAVSCLELDVAVLPPGILPHVLHWLADYNQRKVHAPHLAVGAVPIPVAFFVESCSRCQHGARVVGRSPDADCVCRPCHADVCGNVEPCFFDFGASSFRERYTTQICNYKGKVRVSMRVMRMVLGVLPVLLVGLCGCGNKEEKMVDVDEALDSFMNEKDLIIGEYNKGEAFVFTGIESTEKAETKHTLRFASIANALAKFAVDVGRKEDGKNKSEYHIDGDMQTHISTISADLSIGKLHISYNRCFTDISVMGRDDGPSVMCGTTSLSLDGKCVVKVVDSEVNDVRDVKYAVDSGLTWAMLENALDGSRYKIALLYEMSGMSRDGERQYGVVLGIKVTK